MTADLLREFVSAWARLLERERFHPLVDDQIWTGIERMRRAADEGDAATVASLSGAVSRIVVRAIESREERP